jgi:hypothetical protein
MKGPNRISPVICKERTMRKTALFFAATLGLVLSNSLWAFEPDTSDELQLEAQSAILEIQKTDPGIKKFFESAAGYAVFRRSARAASASAAPMARGWSSSATKPWAGAR